MSEADKERGMYAKYQVSRVDGKPMTPGVVLEFKDPNARKGIAAYSKAVREDGYERFADDLDEQLREYYPNG